MPTLFISHAAADSALAEDVKTMIQKAVGLGPNRIFFSSGAGTGIPAGRNFVEYIREKMDAATFVVSIITPAFRESEFCLAELGAVWVAADKDFFPVCSPEVDRGDLQATLTGIQVERLDESAALSTLLQRLCDHFGESFNAGAAAAVVQDFLATLPQRLENLTGASKVPAERLTAAEETIERLGSELTGVRDDLSATRERFDELKKTRTQMEAAAVNLPVTTEERIADGLSRARDAVLELPKAVRPVLPAYLRGEGLRWPGDKWESEELGEYVNDGLLDDGGDGNVYPNREWPAIDEACEAIEEAQQLLRELEEDGREWFVQTYGVPPDLKQNGAFSALLSR